ncbi:MAG: two-component system, cell cycle sensor histidine kinase and response regulator CckA [Verrucomicrobiota bacterium]
MIIREKRILIAEDEPQVRDSIYMLLTIDDHVVAQAENGAQALDMFTKGKFDLVITDFEMPVMKGNLLAAKIKQLAPKQPILMITAYNEKINPDNPVDMIITKPFTFDDLRDAIAKILA